MQSFRLIPLALLLLALSGCAATQNGQAIMGPLDTSPVIFSYDGQSYTADDYSRLLEELVGADVASLVAEGQTREQIDQLADERNVRGGIFDQMVQEALLGRYARQHGIGVNPAAVDEAVLSSVSPAADSPFLITAPDRVRAASELLRLEVVARNTRADMIRARQIIVLDQAAADTLRADLDAGADFAALARERSLDGNTQAQGGDLGWSPRGNLPPEVEEVAFAAEPGTVVTATSQLGIHVIEVFERQEARAFASFEALQNSANAQQYYEETFLPWYEELRREAENSGELQIAPNFDPNTIPLPYPPGTP